MKKKIKQENGYLELCFLQFKQNKMPEAIMAWIRWHGEKKGETKWERNILISKKAPTMRECEDRPKKNRTRRRTRREIEREREMSLSHLRQYTYKHKHGEY